MSPPTAVDYNGTAANILHAVGDRCRQRHIKTPQTPLYHSSPAQYNVSACVSLLFAETDRKNAHSIASSHPLSAYSIKLATVEHTLVHNIYIQGRPSPNNRDATSPSPFPFLYFSLLPLPLLTGVRDITPWKMLELTMLGGEFYSILDIKLQHIDCLISVMH